LLGVHGVPGNRVSQRHAVKKLHHHKSATIVITDVIDGADAGKTERRCCLTLAPKPVQGLLVTGGFFGKKLERDKAVQASVFGLVHDTHAAAELVNNPVMRDGVPNKLRRRSRSRRW
jgi:hypothetical protein